MNDCNKPSGSDFGCIHYSRKCALLAPCCSKKYVCRLCHDDVENHELNRKKVELLICLNCNKQQKVSSNCENCGVLFGNYSCLLCCLFDDKDKEQFHCEGCEICRVGGRENFFHCEKCGFCLSLSAKDSHKCVEQASRSDCPVCMEYLHSSREQTHISPCGHLMHRSCYTDMLKNSKFACPICNQSMIDMKDIWKNLDDEREAVEMPDEYKDKLVHILCRDCHKECYTKFHVVGLRCEECGSYNTCQSAANQPSSS